MTRYLPVIILAIVIPSGITYAKEVPFTLEDRDRIIRLESRSDEGFRQIDKRFEQIDKRFEQIDKRFEQIDNRIERLENIMMWGFGLLFTTMIGLVGFVLWDRRTALAPAIRKNKELEEREELLERALKEFAKKEPRLAAVLKEIGLM